jgi:hypothetical protein
MDRHHEVAGAMRRPQCRRPFCAGETRGSAMSIDPDTEQKRGGVGRGTNREFQFRQSTDLDGGVKREVICRV